MGSGYIKPRKAGVERGCRALGEQGGSLWAEAEENQGRGRRDCASRKAGKRSPVVPDGFLASSPARLCLRTQGLRIDLQA